MTILEKCFYITLVLLCLQALWILVILLTSGFVDLSLLPFLLLFLLLREPMARCLGLWSLYNFLFVSKLDLPCWCWLQGILRRNHLGSVLDYRRFLSFLASIPIQTCSLVGQAYVVRCVVDIASLLFCRAFEAVCDLSPPWILANHTSKAYSWLFQNVLLNFLLLSGCSFSLVWRTADCGGWLVSIFHLLASAIV